MNGDVELPYLSEPPPARTPAVSVQFSTTDLATSSLPASQHRLQPHLQLLQEFRGAPSFQDHLQTPGLPGHRCGHGGAPEDRQELGKEGARGGPSGLESKGACFHFSLGLENRVTSS